MRKSLYDLSWQVEEEVYRASPAISYSTLSTFARGGHSVIPSLFDKKEGEALRFGSLVDTLMTEPELVNERFFIADFPSLTDTIAKIVKSAFIQFGQQHRSLNKIPFDGLLKIVDDESYYTNWKPETRVNDIIKKGSEYYDLLYLSGERVIMSVEDYKLAQGCINTLKTHPYTKDLFLVNPFDKEHDKYFQLKFILESDLLPSPVRCMFDLIVVDHINKTIRPCDLKTTGKDESSFEDSFLQWRYDLQATLYSWILSKIIGEDDYYKDFEILPFRFIVINRYNQTPLTWDFKENLIVNDWIDNRGNIMKGWRTLLKELTWHLRTHKHQYSVEAYLNEGVLTINNLKPYDGRLAQVL